jgi:hypothetical protein
VHIKVVEGNSVSLCQIENKCTSGSGSKPAMPRINRAGQLSPLRAIALAVSLAGIAMLIGGNGIEASVEKLPGIACALAGAVCVALGTVLTKHFPLAMPPLSLAAWQIGRSRSSGLRSSSRIWPHCHMSAGCRCSI